MNYEPTTALNEGIRLLQANDFAGAAIQLEQAARQTPQDGRAHGYLGVAYARQGNAAASVQALQAAARLQPQDSGAYYNLAVGLVQAQRQPEARTALEQALRIDPGNARARTALQGLAATTQAPASPPFAAPSAYTPTNQPGSAPLYNSETAASLPASHYTSVSTQDQSSYGMPSVASLTGEPVAPAMMSLNGSPVAPLPADYQTPRLTQGMAPPPAYGMGTPAPGMGGIQYMQQSRPMSSSQPPDTGKRILRGLGWGAAFGQWWTLWLMFSMLRGGGVPGGAVGVMTVIILTVFMGTVCAFLGSVMGLIIGAVDAMPDAGAMIGMVFGIAMLGLQFVLAQNGFLLPGAILWIFSGRFIGRHIAARVQQPVMA